MSICATPLPSSMPRKKRLCTPTSRPTGQQTLDLIGTDCGDSDEAISILSNKENANLSRLEKCFELTMAQTWTSIQQTWEYDECPLSRDCKKEALVPVPGLFVFLGIVSKILNQTGLVPHAISCNELFARYTAFTSNVTPVYFFNTITPSKYYKLVQTRRNVELHVTCNSTAGSSVHTFTPSIVFGTLYFTSGQVYTLTKEFQKTVTGGRQHVVYNRTLYKRPEYATPTTPSEAVKSGTGFDLFFPKIPHPRKLAKQFAPPRTSCMTKAPKLGRQIFAGFIAFLISVSSSERGAPSTWTTITPKTLLCAGSFTFSPFPKGFVPPTKSQITYMWNMLQAVAALKKSRPQSTPIVGWVVSRALAYAQRVRTHYAVEQLQPHLLQFKMMCVVWQLLQLMFAQSPELYRLLIRSFCYASTHQCEWQFTQKTLQFAKVPDTLDYYPQRQGVSTTMLWDVSGNKVVQTWSKRRSSPGQEDGSSAWWYMCPFTIMQEELESPMIQFGPSFKVDY